VLKDKRRPFVVNTNEDIIKPLGICLDIASCDKVKNVEVVLLEVKIIFLDKKISTRLANGEAKRELCHNNSEKNNTISIKVIW